MHVGRVMHTDLVTVPPDTSLVKAREVIDENQIEHLLVVDKKGKLIGMVSDRDLKQSWASPATTLSVHELNYLLKQLLLFVGELWSHDPAWQLAFALPKFPEHSHPEE